ncbi:hypothetical protein SAMN03159338_3160 [Sphingomonas sp. NFR04]|uniref:hypothetical protein n=1 Tax=Sphingomonas sp. NFR04 TaxID=1566283 RepID=UPI0008E26D6B|nr:hypothetical protein [Sphingomonas sp. NFR04]SFK05726.1 hypothetical protein SAMN03159338_3160 [Sphingomonas sp. NFR04]
MQHIPPPPVTTSEIRVVDAAGTPRILLSAAGDGPAIVLIGRDTKPAAAIALDSADRPSVKLANPSPGGPVAAIEIDDKGAHVKFDRAGGASSYLFLNNGGTSGVVLIDAKGVRQAAILVGADGKVTLEGVEGNAPAGR